MRVCVCMVRAASSINGHDKMYPNGTLAVYYADARQQQQQVQSVASSGIPRVTSNADSAAQWNMVGKLLLLTILSSVGTIGNVFAISAVMLDDRLKRIGNAFIANLAIADFVVSAFAIPATCAAILAGQPDHKSVCTFQWVAAVLCYHVSSLTLMFVALESHGRILGCPNDYETLFSRRKIIAAISGIWLVSTVCVGSQFLFQLGPDYCHMIFRGNIFYHLTVGAALFCVPTVLAFSAYFRCLFALNDTNSLELQNALMTSPTLAKDVDLMKANFVVFILFLAFWFPLGIVLAVGSLRPISRRLYENVSWLALSNSCVNSYVYGVRNRFFRAAYNKLFHYCFCKTSVSFGSDGQRRTIESMGCIGSSSASTSTSIGGATAVSTHGHHHHHHHNYHHHHHHQNTSSSSHSTQRPATDVRVHIIPGYNIYAPQRTRVDTSTHHRETKTLKNHSKYVYEL